MALGITIFHDDDPYDWDDEAEIDFHRGDV